MHGYGPCGVEMVETGGCLSCSFDEGWWSSMHGHNDNARRAAGRIRSLGSRWVHSDRQIVGTWVWRLRWRWDSFPLMDTPTRRTITCSGCDSRWGPSLHSDGQRAPDVPIVARSHETIGTPGVTSPCTKHQSTRFRYVRGMRPLIIHHGFVMHRTHTDYPNGGCHRVVATVENKFLEPSTHIFPYNPQNYLIFLTSVTP